MYKLLKIGVSIFTLSLLVACSEPAKTEAYFENHKDEVKPTLEKCEKMESMSSNQKETCKAAGKVSMFMKPPKKESHGFGLIDDQAYKP